MTIIYGPGADPALRDTKGMSALLYLIKDAVGLRQQQTKAYGIQLLSSVPVFFKRSSTYEFQNMDFDELHSVGNTALHVAVLSKNSTATKLLIQVGAKIDKQNINGNTPLVSGKALHPLTTPAHCIALQ